MRALASAVPAMRAMRAIVNAMPQCAMYTHFGSAYPLGLYSFGPLRMYVCVKVVSPKILDRLRRSIHQKFGGKSLITTRWQQIVAVAPILFVLENT